MVSKTHVLLVRIQSFPSVPHGTIQKSAMEAFANFDNWLCCDCTPCESQQWHGNSSYPIMPLTECGSVWESTCFGSKGSGVQISPLRLPVNCRMACSWTEMKYNTAENFSQSSTMKLLPMRNRETCMIGRLCFDELWMDCRYSLVVEKVDTWTRPDCY